MQLKRSSVAGLIVAVLALTPLAVPAAQAEPPTPARTIRAVLIDPWEGCGDSGAFKTLNDTWSSFGSVQVAIDGDNPALCGGDSFTLADLEASHADVVILSDPAGGNSVLAADEVAALQAYVDAGHHLVGTYLTFYNPGSGADNTALAPLFGLKQDNGWRKGSSGDHIAYQLKQDWPPFAPLLRDLPSPYVSKSYPSSQVPGDRTWSSDDRVGARFMALSASRGDAITFYRTPDYHAIYISTMPEYLPREADFQLLYNAITFPKAG